MLSKKRYLLIEFFVLFILFPVSLVVDYPFLIKAGSVFVGFAYIIAILIKIEKVSFKVSLQLDWKLFFKRTALTFFTIAIITTGYVLYQDATSLFYVPRTNLKLFFVILGVYSLLSVWPQEVIYRTFFFYRYTVLFKNKSFLIFINAIVFSLAHIFFKNTLVLVLTFIGGLLFGITFLKHRSTILVSIEHAFYGNWLFTVGMGQMLAFPGMPTANG